MMKKPNRFRQTVGAFVAALSMIAAPQQAKAVEFNTQSSEINTSNKSGTLQKQERKQGINVNQSGGLDFDHLRMMDKPNPIYIPYYHTKQTYRSQSRNAKKRRG